VLDQWKEFVGIGGVLGGILYGWLKGRSNEPRRDTTIPEQGRRACSYGEENRERIADISAEQRVLQSEIHEIQSQMNEQFLRLRELEKKISWMAGYLKQKLDNDKNP
jgi:hypothetical protein